MAPNVMRQSPKQQLCDNCIHGILDFEKTGDLDCDLKHPVRFETPPRSSSQAERIWGWRPVASVCRSYATIFDDPRPRPSKGPQRHWKRRFGHPATNVFTPQPLAPWIPPPPLEAPHGPTSERLPLASDLAGTAALSEKYAADLKAGHLLAERLFGKERS